MSSNTKNKRIPLSEPVMAGNEWKYVKECLNTAWVSSAGKFVDTFAESFAAYVGIPHAVPVSSGTAALHVSLIALGLQPDEEMLVPALTFAATANAVIYCGAHPVFIDVEERFLGCDVNKIHTFLTQECVWKDNGLWNKASGRQVRGILPVHLYGHPVDMDALLELARQYELIVVEDATEALGSKYKGQSVGTLGDAGAFSFNGNKVITTGGGGMVVTVDAQLAEQVRFLTTQAKMPGGEYYHTAVGYNYRLTNVQAAIGLAQLEHVDAFIARRRGIAQFYQRELSEISGITVCGNANWAFSNHWLSWILIDKSYGKTKDELLKALNERGIEARSFFIPLHTLPPYRKYQTYCIEHAPQVYEKGLNLPSHVALTEADLEIVVDIIRNK